VHFHSFSRFEFCAVCNSISFVMRFIADTGTWYNIQLKNSVSDGATELSFVTSYKRTVLHVAISSSATKNGDACMPSVVSSDNCIQVHSDIYLHQLADSVAACISKETDAYTMLVEAVWVNMPH